MSAVFNWTLGTDPVWKARYRVLAPMVYGTSWDGYQRQCYGGEGLDWLSDEQAAHFLRLGLVEIIPAEQAAIAADVPVYGDADAGADGDEDDDTTPAAAGPHTDVVDHCIATLELLQVPATAGAPTARTILRGNDYKYGNNVIAGAVRRRKELCGAVPDDEDEL
jgi:hypothetical protein